MKPASPAATHRSGPGSVAVATSIPLYANRKKLSVQTGDAIINPHFDLVINLEVSSFFFFFFNQSSYLLVEIWATLNIGNVSVAEPLKNTYVTIVCHFTTLTPVSTALCWTVAHLWGQHHCETLRKLWHTDQTPLISSLFLFLSLSQHLRLVTLSVLHCRAQPQKCDRYFLHFIWKLLPTDSHGYTAQTLRLQPDCVCKPFPLLTAEAIQPPSSSTLLVSQMESLCQIKQVLLMRRGDRLQSWKPFSLTARTRLTGNAACVYSSIAREPPQI